MRTWVEKLAKAIEHHGYRKYVDTYAINEFEIEVRKYSDGCWLYIIDTSKNYKKAYIRIYEDEYFTLKEKIEICKKHTEDYFINILNNLE